MTRDVFCDFCPESGLKIIKNRWDWLDVSSFFAAVTLNSIFFIFILFQLTLSGTCFSYEQLSLSFGHLLPFASLIFIRAIFIDRLIFFQLIYLLFQSKFVFLSSSLQSCSRECFVAQTPFAKINRFLDSLLPIFALSSFAVIIDSAKSGPSEWWAMGSFLASPSAG